MSLLFQPWKKIHAHSNQFTTLVIESRQRKLTIIRTGVKVAWMLHRNLCRSPRKQQMGYKQGYH